MMARDSRLRAAALWLGGAGPLIAAAMLVGIPLVYRPIEPGSYGGASSLLGPKVVWTVLCALGMGAAAVLKLRTGGAMARRDASPQTTAGRLAVLTLSLFLVAYLASAFTSQAQLEMFRSVKNMLAFCLVFLTMVAYPGSARYFLFALIVAGAVTAATVAAQEFGVVLPGWREVDGMAPPAGTFTHRNDPAYVIGAALIATIDAVANASTRRRYAILSGVATLEFFGLLLTRSRGAWAAALAAVLVLAVGRSIFLEGRRARPRLRARLITISLCLTALVAAIAARPPPSNSESRAFAFVHEQRLVERLNVLANHDSLQTRIVIWRASASMIAESPWTGTGPGRYRLEAAPEEVVYTHTHNEWIMTAVEAGVPAASLFVLFVVAVLLHLASRMRAASHRWPPVLMAIMVVFLCMTSLEVLTRNAGLFGIWGAGLGAAVAGAGLNHSQ
jgi:O-antigen ligase